MAVSRTGDWARARRLLTAAPQRLQAAIGTAVRQEAHALRNEIVQGLTRQAPGGEPLKPPSPLTIAARELEGFGGTKALIVRGDLRNSITVFVQGDEAFIGVSRSARSKDGASMVDLAKLHEFGGPPVIIPMTPKMRRFLFALLRQAGKEPTGGSGRGVIVVQVPARPFLRPAFDKFREGASRRFLERVARELGLVP
ncbi:MAG TPA: phage virion morphogenesis protein [Usitatibacteraceae bacterium]|jgi:phage gpG-like protein|nr:MAG: Phage virion morphogenesis family protein [bacterium ADurb.BinA028]HQW38049.1 phage virion morphogenesis protein [Usitatibacteraceae bacterium]